MHPLYVWMPPYVWIAPCMFGCPHVWTPFCMFGCPHMFGYSPVFGHPYVWMSPECVDTPICLDAPMYVWKMFGCLLYIYNTKKACFVILRGCPYAPYIWMPCMFGHPPYVWMSLIPLDATIHLAASKHMGGSQTNGHPNIQGVSKHRGHPNIQGASKHMG